MLVDGHWINFAPVLMMLVIVVLNHAFTHRRGGQRETVEASRLRAALVSELQALRDIYRLNLELIDSDAGYLISSRSPIIIYKSNLGRVTTQIETPALQKLVSLYARNEIIEELLSANANPNGGLSFKLRPDCRLDELKQMYAVGIHKIARVCRELSPEVSGARPGEARPRMMASALPSAAGQQPAGAGTMMQ